MHVSVHFLSCTVHVHVHMYVYLLCCIDTCTVCCYQLTCTCMCTVTLLDLLQVLPVWCHGCRHWPWIDTWIRQHWYVPMHRFMHLHVLLYKCMYILYSVHLYTLTHMYVYMYMYTVICCTYLRIHIIVYTYMYMYLYCCKFYDSSAYLSTCTLWWCVYSIIKDNCILINQKQLYW